MPNLGDGAMPKSWQTCANQTHASEKRDAKHEHEVRPCDAFNEDAL